MISLILRAENLSNHDITGDASHRTTNHGNPIILKIMVQAGSLT